MKTIKKIALFGIASFFLFLPASVTAQDIQVHGQLRPRYELRAQSSQEDAFVSMRARLTVNALLENDVRVFLQVQDVRLWGDETNTLFDFSADNFDLHQGYIEFSRPGDTQLAARVGRQEVNFGGQRLVGAVGWTQQARSFDGIGLVANSTGFRIDLVGVILTDETSVNNTDDTWFVAANAVLKSAGPGMLDLYGIFNSEDLADTDQATLGARYHGMSNGLNFRAEASLQTGTRAGSDVSAFMFGGRLGKAFGDGSVTLWYDYLSGDDDLTDGDTKVFDTLFATNHKFYGFADLFLNIPVHTGMRGLQDIAVKGTYQMGSRTNLSLALHQFRLVETAGVDSHLADEADLIFNYRYSANTTFQIGLAQVAGKQGLADIGRNSDNMTWLYVMTNATF